MYEGKMSCYGNESEEDRICQICYRTNFMEYRLCRSIKQKRALVEEVQKERCYTLEEISEEELHEEALKASHGNYFDQE